MQYGVKPMLLWGAIAATIAAITGYILSINDDYDQKLVNLHQWMGISVALLSWILYATIHRRRWRFNNKFIALILFIVILITGHLGGSLTHGSDYLTQPLADVFGNDSTATTTIKPLANVQEALAYKDVVRPVLQTKCFSCHGPNKQKGKLRMDDEQSLLKGGKDGKVIEAGNAAQSEIIKRMMLPVDNEDHMPPKEKPQPTETQINFIQWWINNGADFTKKVKELPQTDKQRAELLTLQQLAEKKEENSFVPSETVAAADEKVLDQLREKGIVVLPVAQNSNYLTANFVAHPITTKEDLQLLSGLKKQLIELKLSYSNIGDSALATIATFKTLRRLSLDHTAVSDAGIVELKSLDKLEYLNLVATKVSTAGILQLNKLRSLHSLFIYQAKVQRSDWPALQKAFPQTHIDSGGYSVESLPTDTMVMKAKKYQD